MTGPPRQTPDPASPGAADAPRAWRDALWILAGSTAIRLLLGALVPLFPDETYYWDWSRRLSAGYFDHPPLIAVLVRAGTLVLGDTPLGVRLFAILAGTLCGLAVVRTARQLEGDAAARLASLVFSVLPLATAGFVLATPDAPMLCGAAWALYFVVRAVDSGLPITSHRSPITSHRSPITWVYAGLSLGLAMASKFSAVLIPVSIALAFVAHAKLQNRFGESGPWIAVGIAIVMMLPVLWWNATHDWAAVRWQLGHGLGPPRGGLGAALNRELELLGGQAALVSPILFVFLLRAVRDALRYSEEGVRLVLGVAAVVPIGVFMLSATRRSVEANWPALAWLPATALLASDPPWWPRRARRWFTGGLWLAGTLSAIVSVHVLVPVLPIPAPRDQTAKAFGWELVARTVAGKRDAIRGRASSGSGEIFIAAERYQDASELAFHLDDHPFVLSLNLTGRPNQYDLWPTFRDRAEAGAVLLLVLDDQPDEPRVIRRLSCCFARIDQSESAALMRGDEAVTRKRLWVLTGWSGGWPVREQR